MSTDGRIDKEDVVHMYNGMLLSHKKETTIAIWSNIDGPSGSHTEWRKAEKDKCHMIPLVCGILKENGTNEPIYIAEIELQM